MPDPYDPTHVQSVGAYLDDRRHACGFVSLKMFAAAAGIDAKTAGWLVNGRPPSASGTRFSTRVLHGTEKALQLPRGSIEAALQTGDLAAFEPQPRRRPAQPLPPATTDELVSISRKLYNILWRLPAGEPSRVHLSAAVNEVERAIHEYPADAVAAADPADDESPTGSDGETANEVSP